MSARTAVDWDGLTTWNRGLALAVLFGVASIPWTYAFVAELEIPLWPAFIGSATVFAAGGGIDGLRRGYASNLAGIGYAAATLALVDGYLGGGVVAMSLVVGAFMFVASLHAFVPLLSFTPGAFFGYATLFSVEAAGASVLGLSGLGGETVAAALSMLIGAVIGFGAALLSDRVATA